jgi:formylglycine-generating enzyme required for sulfatase activity
MLTIEDGKLTMTKRTWREPGFAQTPDDPVCGVDWTSAVTFCQWLTERERAEKRLNAESRYRLPTDAEWSLACGITDNSATAPRYPWGSVFPPPEGAGNYAGAEVLADPWPSERPSIRGYRDRFRRTAPVGSFTPNAIGIFDLGGNVWEWTDDGPAKEAGQRWVRGGGWLSSSARVLDSNFRTVSPFNTRNSAFGFRIVLARR